MRLVHYLKLLGKSKSLEKLYRESCLSLRKLTMKPYRTSLKSVIMLLPYLMCLKRKKVEFGVGHAKLTKELEKLEKTHKALESDFSTLTKSHE